MMRSEQTFWVARDHDGIFLFEERPTRLSANLWHSDHGYWRLPDFLFPEIRWESEPAQVTISRKGASDGED